MTKSKGISPLIVLNTCAYYSLYMCINYYQIFKNSYINNCNTPFQNGLLNGRHKKVLLTEKTSLIQDKEDDFYDSIDSGYSIQA